MVIKVLVSFPFQKEIDKTLEKFRVEFEKKGVSVLIDKKVLLSDVETFLSRHRDYSILILKECIRSNSSLKPHYIERLRHEYPQLKIVLILDNQRYKSSYIKDVFDCNVYNCLLFKDASIENIVYISLNPRTKEEAESYYGLISNFKANEDNYANKANKLKSRTYGKNGGYKDVIFKEKIVYKTPSDYQKVIGIYSPYPLGKTVIASNLAKYYSNEKLNVTLIDTDFIKKDILYYFPLEDTDFFKLVQLNKDLRIGKEIIDSKQYGIKIKKNLRIFTDHRDSKYEMTLQMINLIVRSSKSNIIIIDIARNLEDKMANEILELCDEKLIVADKMLSTLNGLPYRLSLNKYNLKNLNLIINRNIDVKGLSDSRIESYFKNIKISENEVYNIDFNHVFFIPNKFELILNSTADREVAYGKDTEFDESIKAIGNSIYRTNTSSNKGGIKGLIGRLIK